MGSDNAPRGRRRSPSALSPLRLLILFVAIVFLFWFTSEPAASPNAGRNAVKKTQPRKLIAEREVPAKAEAKQAAEAALPAAAEAEEEEEVLVEKPLVSTARGLYRFSAVDIDGDKHQLSEFSGLVSLVVNVASNCGYTASNYAGLVAVYDELKDQGESGARAAPVACVDADLRAQASPSSHSPPTSVRAWEVAKGARCGGDVHISRTALLIPRSSSFLTLLLLFSRRAGARHRGGDQSVRSGEGRHVSSL
jgi:Glutathione peroxidase